MAIEHLVKLVGNNFRESGRAVLPILPEGQPLLLEPEPTNPHDPDAIKVCVDMGGHRFSPTNEGPIIHLGYIPRPRGNDPGTLQVAQWMKATRYETTLTFDMMGGPVVRITILEP
jgi:hypothetical protein